MAEQNIELYKNIKSGEYFKEALNWYNLKYVYPLVQRSYFIFITIICVFIIIFTFISLYNFLPLIRPVSISVGLENLADDFAEIKVMPEKNDPNLEVKKFLLSEYVKARESYAFDDIEKNLGFIKNMSSETEYLKFANFMNIRNPNSPILRYKQNATVSVKILSFRELQLTEPATESQPVKKNRRAEIVLQRNERTSSNTKTASFIAEIDFTMTDITYDKKNKNFLPLDISVQNYKLSQVAESKK